MGAINRLLRLFIASFAICIISVLTISFFSYEAHAVELVDSGSMGDDITWTLDSEGTLTISGSGTIPYPVNVVDPPTYSPWRAHISEIENVIIEEGITGIGVSSFRLCDNLKSVTIPDGVTSIGEEAFLGCKSLKTIMIPQGVSRIGKRAFSGCSNLEIIGFFESEANIEENAFAGISSDYMVYTWPDSKTSAQFSQFHVKNLCEPGTVSNIFLGFKTDRIVIAPNGTAVLDDYVYKYGGLDYDVSISDDDLFYYDNGIIASLGEGEAELTISSGDLSETVRLISTSDSVEATDIALNTSQITVKKGDVVKVYHSLLPNNTTDSKVYWRTEENHGVAQVSNGYVTGWAPGTTTIAVRLDGHPEIMATCQVTVTDPLIGIATYEAFDPTAYTLKTGETKEIGYYLYPKDATDIDLSFNSSAPNIVFVGEDGKMTARDNGTALITISSGNVSRTVEVSTYTPIEGLSFAQPAVHGKCGDKIQLEPVFEPENTTDRDVIWSSNKESTASVDQDGLVTIHGKGIATIKATDKGYSATCDIVCNDHNWAEDYTIDKEATCTETGSKSIHCIGCNEIKEDSSVDIPLIDHDLVAYEAQEASCIKAGNTAYWKCSKCNECFSDAEGESPLQGDSWVIKALGHKWTHIKNPAGLLKNGSEYDYCTVCKTKQNVKTIAGYATYYVKSFKVAKAKKSFTAKWKKQNKANQKKFNGYQIRYSTNSDMSMAKYTTASKKSKSKKIKRLAKKTTYYVQVRTYTNSGGTTFYSKWSAIKRVKTK